MELKRILFFALMITVWVLIHVGMLWRFKLLFRLETRTFLLLLLPLLLLALSYIPARAFEGSFPVFSAGLESAASVWMALVLPTLSVFMALELVNLLSLPVTLVAHTRTFWDWACQPGRAAASGAVILLLSVGLSVTGHFLARHLSVVRLEISGEGEVSGGGAGQESRGLRLLQISDLHLGPVFSDVFLEKVIARGRELKPDVLLLTGDIVEHGSAGSFERLDHLLAAFPKARILMSLGNHEFYGGPRTLLAQLDKRPRITLLRSKFVSLMEGVKVLGIDDPQFSDGREVPAVPPGVGPEDLLIVMSHRPALAAAFSARPNTVVLAGHTHGGQIFPFSLLSRLGNAGYSSGLYRLGQRAVLHVSRGAGTWGPPIRIGAPPDVVVIDLAYVAPAGPGVSGVE